MEKINATNEKHKFWQMQNQNKVQVRLLIPDMQITVTTSCCLAIIQFNFYIPITGWENFSPLRTQQNGLPWFLLHSWSRKASIKQDLFFRDTLLPQLSKHFSKQKLSKSFKTCCIYLHSILTASTCSSFNQRVPHINDSADPICVGMELSFKGLVFLVFALNMTKAKLLETGQRAPKLFSWAEKRAQELSTDIKRFLYSLS